MAARGGHTHVVKLLLESEAYVDDYDHLAVAAEAVSNGNNNNSCRYKPTPILDQNIQTLTVLNPCLVIHSATGFGGGEGCPGGGGGREFMDIIALMVAAQHGHEATVRLLLEWGSDVNFSQKTTGWGPLMVATLSGKVGSVDGRIIRYGYQNVFTS